VVGVEGIGGRPETQASALANVGRVPAMLPPCLLCATGSPPARLCEPTLAPAGEATWGSGGGSWPASVWASSGQLATAVLGGGVMVADAALMRACLRSPQGV
jgi:hypothetical protein